MNMNSLLGYPLQLCTETWNIVPVLGAIQADLMYRVYNISRSNWMFKHPWDSWNRMQFIVQARSPPATSRRPKAEGLRTRAKRAVWTRSVLVSSEFIPKGPKCIHSEVFASQLSQKTGIKDTSGSREDHWSFKHPCWEKSRSTS